MSQPASWLPDRTELWPASSPEHTSGEAADEDEDSFVRRLPVEPEPEPEPLLPPRPPLPRPQCDSLLRLPDHLLLEVGLWLDDLRDLHTLLRSTCLRLNQITEPAAVAAAAPAAPAAAAVPHPSGSSDTMPQAGGSDHGNDRATVAPTSVTETAAPAAAALADKPWPPSADIQARWLLRWRRSAPGDEDGDRPTVHAFSSPAWRGDADVTLAILERMAAPGHLPRGLIFEYNIVCPLLIELSGPDPKPQHTRVVDAVIRRHWAAVAALPPVAHATLLWASALEGSLTMVRAVLRLGAGSETCDSAMGDQFRSCCPPALSARIRWDDGLRSRITAADVALYEAARCRQGVVVEEILVAEQEGRASLSPVSVILVLTTIVVGGGWADGTGPMAAALELLTATPQLRDRVRQAASSGAMPSEIILALFIRVMGAVATGTNVAMVSRLLSALPRLRLAIRADLAREHIAAGHSAMLPLLLDPHGPHDAASPVDPNEAPLRDHAIMALADLEILEDLLVEAAGSGMEEAAAAVLGAAEGLVGVGGTMSMVAGGRVLRQAAVRGHAGVVGVLLGGSRRGGVPFEVRAAAALSAIQRGHAVVAVELLREW